VRIPFLSHKNARHNAGCPGGYRGGLPPLPDRCQTLSIAEQRPTVLLTLAPRFVNGCAATTYSVVAGRSMLLYRSVGRESFLSSLKGRYSLPSWIRETLTMKLRKYKLVYIGIFFASIPVRAPTQGDTSLHLPQTSEKLATKYSVKLHVLKKQSSL